MYKHAHVLTDACIELLRRGAKTPGEIPTHTLLRSIIDLEKAKLQVRSYFLLVCRRIQIDQQLLPQVELFVKIQQVDWLAVKDDPQPTLLPHAMLHGKSCKDLNCMTVRCMVFIMLHNEPL